MDFIKIKNFCTANDMYHRKSEKITHRMEEMPANHICGKGPVSTIYKELLQKKKDNPIKNGQNTWIDFSKEDMQMANENDKMLDIIHQLENINQNHVRYHFIPTRYTIIAIIKKDD